jgi:3-oxoacyl-[acyl-carrier protein] reductase
MFHDLLAAIDPAGMGCERLENLELCSGEALLRRVDTPTWGGAHSLQEGTLGIALGRKLSPPIDHSLVMRERSRIMFLELPERVALVTGAARGIGFAIAERHSRAGARVVIADIDEESAVAAVDRLREWGGKTAVAVADITKPDEVGAMVERAIDAFGKLELLVNNAGITGCDASLSKITDEDWERVLKLNLTAAFYCCRAAIPRRREQCSGAVVNVGSISGKEGNPNMIPYSVSKAGVICLTKALAKEVIHDGVRVNCVAPAVIETPLLG